MNQIPAAVINTATVHASVLTFCIVEIASGIVVALEVGAPLADTSPDLAPRNRD
jgi:hypothetical protein